jgi:hypothetical protein
MSAQARFPFFAACRVAVLASILAAGRSAAQSNATWTGATGNWTDPTVWSIVPPTNPFPNNGQPAGTVYNVTVTNGSGGTITLNTNISINQFTLAGTIAGPSSGGPNSLSLAQSFAWNGGGAFVGALNVQASGGTTIAAPGGSSVTLDTGSLTLGGTTSSWQAGNIFLLNGATLAISSTNILTAAGNDQILVGGSPASAFNNAGTFTKSGGSGTTNVGANTRNDGLISGQTGVLQFSGSVTNNGTLFAAGGALQVSGPLTNLSGGTLTGGTYRSSSNLALATGSAINTIAANTTVQLDGVNSIFAAVNPVSTINGTFRLTNGRQFTTAGDLTTSGTLDVDSTSLLGINGKLTVPSTGTASILNGMVSMSPTSGTTSVAGTLNVGVGATLSGTQLLTVMSGGKLAVQGTVTQPVTVASNGILSGNALIKNKLTILAGGHLQPGNSPGTTTVNGDMTLNGSYDWDLNGNDNTMAGGTFDKVLVSGTTALDPPAVNVAFGPALSFSDPFWTTPKTWDILDTGQFSVDTVLPDITTPGGFQGIYPNGAFALSLSNTSLNINWYPQGVPEPGSCALVGLAAAAWAARRFFRKPPRCDATRGR